MGKWRSRPLSTSASARRSELTAARFARCLALPAAFVWAGPGAAQPPVLDRVVAVVEGEVILQSDVRGFLELGLIDAGSGSVSEADVVTSLIERQLMLDEVNRAAVPEPPPATVDERYATLRGRFAGDEALHRVLDRHGLSPDDLRQIVIDELRLAAYVADRFAALEPEQREQARANWVDELISRAQVRRALTDP